MGLIVAAVEIDATEALAHTLRDDWMAGDGGWGAKINYASCRKRKVAAAWVQDVETPAQDARRHEKVNDLGNSPHTKITNELLPAAAPLTNLVGRGRALS